MTDREPTESPEPERRVVERRRFGGHKGISVDRRTPADRRDDAPADAENPGTANRRAGRDRRTSDAAHTPDRRKGGRDRRKKRRTETD